MSHITFCWRVSTHCVQLWCLLSWPIFLFWWSFCTSEYLLPFSGARNLSSKKKMLWMLPCRHISDYDFSIHIVSPEHNKSTSGRTESLLNRLIKHYLLPLLGSAQVPPLVLICCQKEWTAAFWKQVTVKGNEGGRQRTTYSWSLWDRSSMSRQNPTKETNCGQCSERLPFVHWSWILVLTTWR